MKRYVLRRLASALPTLFGVALITFLLFHAVGGDPVAQLAGKYATDSEVTALRHEYGFDRSLPVQFFRFLGQIVTLDFERSFQTKQTIGRMLRDGAGVSIALTLPAFLFSQVLSVGLALLAVAFRRRFLDRLILVKSVLAMSVSVLPYILFGQYVLAYKLNLFPISGFEPGFPSAIAYLALPWIIWTVASLGGDIRFYRTVFLEELEKDYIRTARSKGVGEGRILFVHVLRNAASSVVTRTVVVLPFLLTGSLLLESFFGLPGLGNLTVEAFNNADWPVVKAVTLLGGALFIAFNLFSDLICARLDPRVVLR